MSVSKPQNMLRQEAPQPESNTKEPSMNERVLGVDAYLMDTEEEILALLTVGEKVNAEKYEYMPYTYQQPTTIGSIPNVVTTGWTRVTTKNLIREDGAPQYPICPETLLVKKILREKNKNLLDIRQVV